MGFLRKGLAMSPKDPNLSPSGRLLARRRRIFVRDWLLVLVALALATAGGAFHRDHSPSQDASAAAQTSVR